jgi:hypothetical protein
LLVVSVGCAFSIWSWSCSLSYGLGLGFCLAPFMLGIGPCTAFDLLALFWLRLGLSLILAFVLVWLRSWFWPCGLGIDFKNCCANLTLFFHIYPLSIPFTFYGQKEPPG